MGIYIEEVKLLNILFKRKTCLITTGIWWY